MVQVSGQIPTYLIFTAEWCGHCQRFKPEIEKLKSLAGRDDVKLDVQHFDSDRDSDVMQQMQIRGYPTVLLYLPATCNINGERNLVAYRSGRDAKQMLLTADMYVRQGLTQDVVRKNDLLRFMDEI